MPLASVVVFTSTFCANNGSDSNTQTAVRTPLRRSKAIIPPCRKRSRTVYSAGWTRVMRKTLAIDVLANDSGIGDLRPRVVQIFHRLLHPLRQLVRIVQRAARGWNRIAHLQLNLSRTYME